VNRFTSLAVCAAAVVSAACADDLTAPLETADHVVGTAAGSAPASLLVVFQNQSIPSDFAAQVASLGGIVEEALPQVGVAFVSGLDEAAAAALTADGRVKFVEPEVVLPLSEPVLSDQLSADDLFSPEVPGTATYHYLQWHLRQIGAPQAWAAGRLGSSKVTVGIIDTGLDYTNRDLQGLVDLARSRSFLPTEDAVVAQFLGTNFHPVFDLQGHGTHVGATVSSNAIITAGVTSRVTLVGLKVCRSGIPGLTATGCPASATFAAITYAADNGIDVVNLSLGGLFTRRGSGGYEETVNRVFNYAKAKKLTVVVSAGNSNVDLDRGLVPTPVLDEEGNPTGEVVVIQYPSLYATYCSSTHTICVSATGPASATNSQAGPWFQIDNKAGYSNYGRDAITVAAPGGTGAGLVWAACPTRRVVRTGLTSWVGQLDSYCASFPTGKGGTSMAAPHVAGLAALMVERHGRNPDKVAEAIQKFADDLGEPGNDPIYGKGRINVARALGL
jgi:lantibiotic leader peptide-processing serine protease